MEDKFRSFGTALHLEKNKLYYYDNISFNNMCFLHFRINEK